MSDSVCRCLDLAEKIVAVLDGGEVFKKYSRLKDKMFRSVPQNEELDPHIKKIALEIRELNRQLEDLKESRKNSQSIENFVAVELSKINKKVLPNYEQMSHLSIEESISTLSKTIESRIEASSYFREQYTRENNSLREKISAYTSSVNEELERIKCHHVEVDHKFRSKAQTVNARIAQLEEEIGKVSEELEHVEEENADMESSLSTKASQQKQIMFRRNKAIEADKATTARCDELRQSAARLSAEYETKTKDIEMLQAQQRFGIKDADPEDIEELRMVEAEVKKLEAENQKLMLDLKKRRLAVAGIDNSDVTKLPSISVL